MKRELFVSQVLLLTMVGCSQLPQTTTKPVSSPIPHTTPKTVPTPPSTTAHENGVVITPYPADNITKEALPTPPVVQPPQTTTVVIPTKQPPKSNPVKTATSTQNQPPAVQHLITQATQAFRQQQFDRAEHLALQAQRIAPHSSDSYALLAQIALRKNNIPQAQALAQRGASFASDSYTKKQLWSLVLQTAQQQQNIALINKAQSILSTLQ